MLIARIEKKKKEKKKPLVGIQTQQIPYFLLLLDLTSHLEKAGLRTK